MRFVLYCEQVPETATVQAAVTSREHGATVVATGAAGTLIVEADASTMERICAALPGWRFTEERRVARKPGPPGRRGTRKPG